jgi:hypothetical protein
MDQLISHPQSNIDDYRLPWIGNTRKGDITRHLQVFSLHLPEAEVKDVLYLYEVRGLAPERADGCRASTDCSSLPDMYTARDFLCEQHGVSLRF